MKRTIGILLLSAMSIMAAPEALHRDTKTGVVPETPIKFSLGQVYLNGTLIENQLGGLPTQTSNSNKVLTTNGSAASWTNSIAGNFTFSDPTKTLLLGASSVPNIASGSFPNGAQLLISSRAADSKIPIAVYGDYRNGVSGERYAFAIDQSGQIYSNAYMTLNGGAPGEGNPPGSYMLFINSDVAYGSIVHNGLSPGFLWYGQGIDSNTTTAPEVFSVNSNGQLRLSNPYGTGGAINYQKPQLVLGNIGTTSSPAWTYSSLYELNSVLVIGRYNNSTFVQGNELNIESGIVRFPASKLRVGNIGGITDPSTNFALLAQSNSSPSLAVVATVAADIQFSNTAALRMGAVSGSPFAVWFQTHNNGDGTSTYPLVFNPLGGNVGIGNSSPGSALDVTGAINVSDNSTTRQNLKTYFSNHSAKTSNFSIGATDAGTVFDVTTGASNITVTLASAATLGTNFQCMVRKVDSGVGTITANSQKIGNINHWIEIDSDGTTVRSKTIQGGFDSSGNFSLTSPGTISLTASNAITLTAAVNTNINLTTSGTGSIVGNGAGLTSVPISTGISGLGTGVGTALAVNVASAGALVTFNGALGTPSSGTLTNATGLPITGITSTTSAQLRTLLSDENGTGAALFSGATSPVFVTPDLGTPSALVVTNASGTASININGTVGATTPTTGAFTTISGTGAYTNSKSGAASVSAGLYSGVPFAGTGTTSFPLLYVNDANATASTTMSTAGTSLGVNAHTGIGNLAEFMLDGVSKFKIDNAGTITVGSGIIAIGATDMKLRPGSSGNIRYENSGGTLEAYTETTSGGYTIQNNAGLFRFGGGDTGLYRNAARKVEVNNGTAGTYGDLLVRQHYVDQTITAGGTTGAQTINKAAGTVNFAAAAASLVVTNSLVTTSSTIYCSIRTNDATALIKNVVPAAGSFTITLNAAATAETSVGFFVVN